MGLRIRSFKQAAFWSTAINGFSQGLALLFSMVMATIFGAQESTDILYYCIGIFALMVGMTQAVNVSVLIPETMRRRVQTGDRDAMAFINRFLVILVGLILLLSAGLIWNPPGIIAAISKFSVETLRDHSSLLFWLALSFPLQMISQLLLDILISYRFLTLPAMLSCVNRFINVLFVLFFYQRLGVVSVAMGMVLGFALQLSLNLFLLRRAVGWKFGVWRAEPGHQVLGNIFWAELGTVASTLSNYFVLFMTSGFGAGLITSLNYARRMSGMPVELLTTQVSSVTAVKFNELSALKKHDELSRTFGRVSRLLIAVMVPVSALMSLTGLEIITILYGRGAYRDSVGLTAGLFSVFVLILPLHALVTVLARLFVSHQRVRLGASWQIFSSLLCVGVMAVLIRWLGYWGVAWGRVVHLLLYLLALAPFVMREFSSVSMWPIGKAFFRTALASAVSAGTVWAVTHLYLNGSSPWLIGPVKVLFFAFLYGLILQFLPPDRESQQECAQWVGSAWRRMKRLGGSSGGNAPCSCPTEERK